MSDDTEKHKGNFYYAFDNNIATFKTLFRFNEYIKLNLSHFTESSWNRNMPSSSEEKLKLNLNGAVELIKEDKQSENGKSMKKTERDE